jgi:hypothetical protein
MTDVYLAWSLILLAVWALVFRANPLGRRKMWRMSVWTAPLGLTEPLFVPAYWSPPTLFDLAARTGFDLESLLFSFAIGGLASSLYDAWRPIALQQLPAEERRSGRHRFHGLALASPLLIFPVLDFVAQLNPIYSAALAMASGAIASAACRPDLLPRMLMGAIVLMLLYSAYFFTLGLAYPDYVDHVWNAGAISGWRILGIPVEELMFAATLGLLWSSLYEHLAWLRPVARMPAG